MKSTDKLINELSRSHTKVSRDFSPAMRTVLSLYLLSVVVAVSLYFVRPFSFTIRNTGHAIELFGLFFFLNAVTFFGFKYFIPGERKKISTRVVVLSFSFLMMSLIPRLFSPQTYDIYRPNCEFESMAISLATTLIGYFLIRKNEYALKSIASKAIFLSMPMIATLFMHGTCSLQLVHVILCHILFPSIIPILFLIILNRKKV